MNMGEIEKILKGTSSNNLYLVTLKMLNDHYNNSENLPESDEIIEKTKSICDTIAKTKKNSISGPQSYTLLQFVANNLSVYGNITNEQDVKKIYRSLF